MSEKVFHLHIATNNHWPGYNTIHATNESAELLRRAFFVNHLTTGSADPRRAELEAMDGDELEEVYAAEVEDPDNYVDPHEVLNITTLEDAYKALAWYL